MGKSGRREVISKIRRIDMSDQEQIICALNELVERLIEIEEVYSRKESGLYWNGNGETILSPEICEKIGIEFYE